MFDPTVYPYVRAQTYVDANPPAVLSDDFYNPTQDAIARLYGAAAGYSTSLSNEEFIIPQPVVTPAVNDPFGGELAVITNPGGGFEFQSITPAAANMHGVYRIFGAADGDRGGAPGFQAADAGRYVGTLRWIFRTRIRSSNYEVMDGGAEPGLVLGLGTYASGLPVWYVQDGGFFGYSLDSGHALTTVAANDNEWITLWITLRDGDGQVRWYAKLDTDPAPTLIHTQGLAATTLVNVRRYLRYQVKNTAVAADNLDIDTISLGVER